MKKGSIYILLLLVLGGLLAFQPKPKPKLKSAKTPKVTLSDKPYDVRWDRTNHDFGDVREGGQFNTTFKLTNVGKDTVLILHHETSGSSTVPSYSKEPIPPRETSVITVGFNASGKSGEFIKTVGIVMNGGRYELSITGNVLERIKDTLPEAVPVEWDKLEHNFGKITAGEKVETVFRVTNNRKDTLEIENVAGSCGCLVPKWTKGRILPGGAGEVTVRFNSEGKWGQQTRSVAVYTNRGLFTLYLYALIDEN